LVESELTIDINNFASLSIGTLSRDEVDLMLGTELQQTRVYKDAKAEGRTEEGQLLILKMLTRKLSNISPEVRSRVNSLTIEQLESLGEDLLDFTSMADLEAWLSQN
jgi:predicted transposase YdaD